MKKREAVVHVLGCILIFCVLLELTGQILTSTNPPTIVAMVTYPWER